ncbi:replication-relaxation family protein [Dactylosporangium sp. NPDC000521]|uniref:replication-relaxation family protein n=1 Tax=Dactylosporangium sp. NPDC000521 TaxID=3363975 RepID=UPI0036B323F4
MTQPHHDPVLYAQSFLTDRDHRLLDWLYDHQVLSTVQITAALFNRQDSAQERLLRLYRLRLLERFRSARLASPGWHHVLDQAGVELVAALRGDAVPRRVDITAQRRRIAASANLPHLLGVNQFFVDLIAYARRRPDDALLRWWSERQCAAPLRFGSVSMHRVRADGHGIYQEGDRRVAFFLELDRATESVPTLVEKVQRYEQLVTEGGPAWPVLFSLPDRTREQHLHQALGRQPRAVPVATVARDRLLDGTGVADAVWLPTGAAGAPEPPRRLIDLGRLGDPADDSALLRLDRRPLAQ